MPSRRAGSISSRAASPGSPGSSSPAPFASTWPSSRSRRPTRGGTQASASAWTWRAMPWSRHRSWWRRSTRDIPRTLGDTFVHVDDFDLFVEAKDPPIYLAPLARRGRLRPDRGPHRLGGGRRQLPVLFDRAHLRGPGLSPLEEEAPGHPHALLHRRPHGSREFRRRDQPPQAVLPGKVRGRLRARDAGPDEVARRQRARRFPAHRHRHEPPQHRAQRSLHGHPAGPQGRPDRRHRPSRRQGERDGGRGRRGGAIRRGGLLPGRAHRSSPFPAATARASRTSSSRLPTTPTSSPTRNPST